MESLSQKDLLLLINSVFSPRSCDKHLGILIDVPDAKSPDHKDWKKRREMAADWAEKLRTIRKDLDFESVDLLVYPNVHSNNADLPSTAYSVHDFVEPLTSEILKDWPDARDFRNLLSKYQIIMAPTQFSTTAPLKMLAKKFGFRAATMPGFSELMIPALKLNYDEINRRVLCIKKILDPATALDIQFNLSSGQVFNMHFDLRFRESHASGGRFPETGTAGNLPSGECYIVPYEGEMDTPSATEGVLPVQLKDEVILYEINGNRAVNIISTGPVSKTEKEKIIHEPAYANIAEIGFGVLNDFNIQPIGQILLDEKLGLHIAFGRSDHFGGSVGVKDFSSPEAVEHTDRIYLPGLQDQIRIKRVDVFQPEQKISLMTDNQYQNHIFDSP